ncbi:16595_t:CDS:2 [Racocetra fulgida]|uniref:16595_t:CDS:1 n=1 Tax=Racocetra fulgida TaxID=60492 RepID=A0A9N9A640_9GLOM|nr:16595_t:CDS:2 [Racocetra fulgida]
MAESNNLISISKVFKKNIDIFFKNADENNTNNNEIYKQIEAVSIKEKEFFIIEEFFNFEVFMKEQENFLVTEEIYSHSMVQQSNIESEKWSIDDIIQNL